MSEEKKAEFTRRRLLQGTAALAAGSLLPKSAYAQSKGTQPEPTTTGKVCPQNSMVTVTVPTTTVPIPARFVGLSYEKYRVTNVSRYEIFIPSNTNMQRLFALLSGPAGGVLRLGGGSQDTHTWGVDILQTQITNLAGFMTGIGTAQPWQCIYGINLRGQYLISPAAGYTTPTLASEEVVAVQNAGIPLIGVEMGNEPDTWGGGELTGTYPPAGQPGSKAWSLAAYEEIWQYYRNRQPSGPIAATAGGADQQVPSQWSLPFAEWAKGQSIPLHLLTDHFYITDGNSGPAVTDLRDWNVWNSAAGHTPLNIYDFWNTTAQYLQQSYTTYGIPYRLAETNSYWSSGAKGVSDAYVSALWVIDYLFAAAKYGATGTNFHGGQQAWYAPMIDTGTVVTIVNPIFHGMKFFNLALDQNLGTGNLLVTASNGQFYGENVSFYSVQTGPHAATILLINKSAEYYFNVTIDLPFVCSSAPTCIELTTNSTAGLYALNWNETDDTTYTPTVLIQGASITTEGTYSTTGTATLPTAYTLPLPVPIAGGSSVTCWLPTISAVLITVAF